MVVVAHHPEEACRCVRQPDGLDDQNDQSDFRHDFPMVCRNVGGRFVDEHFAGHHPH